jgi:hypothetical protein
LENENQQITLVPVDGESRQAREIHGLSRTLIMVVVYPASQNLS